MTPEALTYLNEALDCIQRNSVKREQIDWPVLREKVSLLVVDAQIPVETYPAIRLALELLDDNHSRLITPESRQLLQKEKTKQIGLLAVHPDGIVGRVYPGSPAEKAGVQVGDRIECINGQAVPPLTPQQFRQLLRSEQLDLTLQSRQRGAFYSLHLQAAPYLMSRPVQGRRLAQHIGYLNLPELLGFSEYGKTYAQSAHAIIQEIDQTATHGWVLDLRCNDGGDMWPMLIGVGPILGGGTCLSFVAPGEEMSVSYCNGQATLGSEGVVAEIANPYQLKHPWPPVAILTSQFTSSASEFLVLAFRGRSHVRGFGEPTYGVPTGVDAKNLADGAQLALTTHWGADRTGQIAVGPLLPDQQVKIDWTQVGTDNDPVLLSAIQWLQEEDSL